MMMKDDDERCVDEGCYVDEDPENEEWFFF